MFSGWIIPAVVRTVTAVETEIGAITCRADIFSSFLRGLKLAYVIKNVKRHGGSGDGAVVARKTALATSFWAFNDRLRN